MKVNNLLKFFENQGWSASTRANYGAAISRLLAECVKDLSEEEILGMLGKETSRDNQTIARNIRGWLGLN